MNEDPVTSEKKRKKPKIALVIGSGGIKPMAAIPLFEFLEAEKIDIDYLIGCSGGAVVAAMRGAGYNSDEMLELISRHLKKTLFNKMDYRTLLGIARMPFGKFDKTSGILKSDNLMEVYRTIYKGMRLEQMSPKMVVQVTDVDTGDGVALESGDAATAVYASAAQFPFLAPLEINGRLYVDGGFSASLPVLEAVKRNADVIIAFSMDQQLNRNFSGFIEYYCHFINRTFTTTEKRQLSLAIDMHHHEIILINVKFNELINMWDISKLPLIIESGRIALNKKKQEILDAIAAFGN
ncbi:MAG: patatin-like phospholipase family protein [Candidatus Wallbacteria bacterium]